MVVENRNLAVGTVLVVTYKKQVHRCLVVSTDNGIGFQLASGEVYSSPSSAGKAITGRVSCDGWKFWSVAEGTPPQSGEAEEPTDPITPKPRKAKTEAVATKMVRLIKKLPNQKGVEEGHTKWHCSGCMASFVAPGTLMPETCPEGHPREAADEFSNAKAEQAEDGGE